MPRKGATYDYSRTKAGNRKPAGEDILDEGLVPEFAELPKGMAQQLGEIARRVCCGGGYFGLSTSDDGNSIRFVIRGGGVASDRRYYALGEFQKAVLKAFQHLRQPVATGADLEAISRADAALGTSPTGGVTPP